VSGDVLVLAPIVVPLAAAVACMPAWNRVRLQRSVAVGATAVALAASLQLLARTAGEGIIVSRLGDWPAPFAIVLVSDLFAAIMTAVGALVGLAVAVYSPAGVDLLRERHGYYPLLLVLLAGVEGAFLTGDLFNLYVCFEVMLMASFVLLALGGERAQLEGAVKYISLNLLSSTFFLTGVGLIYGLTGSLNMADLSVRVAEAADRGLVTTIATMFLVAFGIKAAAFPLFFWLPASYHTPPAAVSALFAGLLTKVGVYALVRVFTLVFLGDTALTHGLILWGAVLSMVSGVLGAAAQRDVRRILSFHIVSQIGYMLLGLGLYTPLALAGTVFYLAHHIVVKTNLFLVAGVIRRLAGTEDLARLGGLYAARPGLALLFLVPALSLAGVPPLSGFWAKLVVVKAGLDAGAWAAVAAALAVSLATLFSMTKIWAEAFWKASPATAPRPGWAPRLAVGTIAALALVTIGLGLGAGPVLSLSMRAGDQLMDPAAYVRAVLPER
jgi:multicomponent Na+:H+ antiporter subunit D